MTTCRVSNARLSRAGHRLYSAMGDGMETAYGMTLDDVQAISDRLAVEFDAIEAQFGSQPLVVGMALVGLIIERTGREGLDQLLYGARQMRAEIMSREKAEARAAKRELRQKR